MTREIYWQCVVAALSFGVAYLFWLTYRDPDRNRVTRFLDWYVEATRFPPMAHRATLLAIIIVTLGTGIATMVFLLGSVVSGLKK